MNRLLGSAFGVLKMGLILSALLIIVHRINFLITFIEPEWLASSFLYEPVRELGSFIFDWVMETDTMALPGWTNYSSRSSALYTQPSAPLAIRIFCHS